MLTDFILLSELSRASFGSNTLPDGQERRGEVFRAAPYPIRKFGGREPGTTVDFLLI
jgi:hypothetical protein